LKRYTPEYETNPTIRASLFDIKALRMEVSYPFLLEVFLDFYKGLLNREELIEILKIVESYVFRRAIVGIPMYVVSPFRTDQV
jgi:uncharacterized protein with ParB-like and HNH nuclease domain